ncbi:hypothetical protein [Sphingobacterium sp.]|uniref:hypothetical protein n=1 Tax=Sphingobacterium sp. TaxID=341027 RepID=UPI0031CFF37E
MSKKVLLLIGIILFFGGYSFAQSAFPSNVSSKISEIQIKNKLRKKGYDLDANIRRQVIDMDSLNFISSCDTVFFLETYDYQTGISYGLIWNKYKSIAYGYSNGNLFFNAHPIFDKHIIALVGMWDVEKIETNGEKSTIINPLSIFASRAMIKQKEIRVDCIAFDDFLSVSK